jgi:hypothetical protein
LVANANRSFVGAVVRGEGFVIDEHEEIEEGVDVSHLLADDPSYKHVIKRYWGGENLNKSPSLEPSRFVIDFEDRSFAEAERWPKALARLEMQVKTQRAASTARSATESSFQAWWKFGRRAKALHEALQSMSFCLARSEVSWHHMVARVKTGPVFQNTLVVFLHDDGGAFAIIQSRIHEMWAYLFGSSMKNDPRYVPRACYQTFCFPLLDVGSNSLKAIGRSYDEARGSIMLERREGMTKTYNRFHDPAEQSADILTLRELHAEMDRAVLRAYADSVSSEEDAAAWNDLADRAEPIFLDETNEDDHTYQGRLFWTSAFRDEVLARLLALNAERAAAEREAGLAPLAGTADDEESET